MKRLYLDNAATSLPKPAAVYEAMHRFAREMGASPGRGNYKEALEAGAQIQRCRERFCKLFDATVPKNAIFTLNCTDANNLAIQGAVRHARRKDRNRKIHLITTDLDHNSVLRPFRDMEQDGIEWTCVKCDPVSGRVDPFAIESEISANTLMVVLNHASNVLGTIQDAGEIGRICREKGVMFMLDAAQSAGHVPISCASMHIDLLSVPGHKGLLGPMGTGMLYIRPGLETRIDSVRQGGTGSHSELDVQPQTLPDKYEPGSHNTPGIVALSEALAWVLENNVEKLREHEVELNFRMMQGLEKLPMYTLLGRSDPASAPDRVGIFTITHESLDSHTLATILEDEFGILARAGLHCAPRAHESAGTLASGGLRLSFSALSTSEDVDRVLNALAKIAATLRSTVVIPAAGTERTISP